MPATPAITGPAPAPALPRGIDTATLLFHFLQDGEDLCRLARFCGVAVDTLRDWLAHPETRHRLDRLRAVIAQRQRDQRLCAAAATIATLAQLVRSPFLLPLSAPDSARLRAMERALAAARDILYSAPVSAPSCDRPAADATPASARAPRARLLPTLASLARPFARSLAQVARRITPRPLRPARPVPAAAAPAPVHATPSSESNISPSTAPPPPRACASPPPRCNSTDRVSNRSSSAGSRPAPAHPTRRRRRIRPHARQPQPRSPDLKSQMSDPCSAPPKPPAAAPARNASPRPATAMRPPRPAVRQRAPPSIAVVAPANPPPHPRRPRAPRAIPHPLRLIIHRSSFIILRQTRPPPAATALRTPCPHRAPRP